VRRTRGRVIELTSVEQLDRRLAAGATSLSGWVLVGLDLRDRADVLRTHDVAGTLFLGCRLPDEALSLRGRGAIVFPAVPDVPVDTFRGSLYTPGDLYDTTPYDACYDARVYAWSKAPDSREVLLAKTLHDHAIDAALAGWCRGRRLVGVMGGHALRRGEPAYAEAARLGRLLGADRVVATGGGPGAMEAANLGARLARHSPEDLDDALAMLATEPGYRPDAGAWARAALAVCDRFPTTADSLGIPTWHYGHEPSNAFATAIAKYFHNATREAILLEVCDAGIVFLPGAAGTVQEIFQDACENYYADPSSVAPMVLVGRSHWVEELPAWPLLRALAADRTMAPLLHLVDTVEEAAALIADRS